MKHTLVLFFVVFLSVDSYSQGTNKKGQQIIEAAFLHPGDNVLKFRGLLIAQGDTSKTIINVDTISAKGTYTYLPSLIDSVVLGNVKFKHVFVQTSNDKKIVVVGFSKVYHRKSDFDSRDFLHQEYFNLAEYMDTVLDVEHVPYEKQSKMYKKDGKAVQHSTSGLTWKKDNITYRLYLDEIPVQDFASKIMATINLNAWKSGE